MDTSTDDANYRKDPALLKGLVPVCKSLWSSMYVGPTGVVFPCSLSFRETETFGNLLEQDLPDFWNNEKYQSARSMFNPNPAIENIPLPCKGCKYYLKCIGLN